MSTEITPIKPPVILRYSQSEIALTKLKHTASRFVESFKQADVFCTQLGNYINYLYAKYPSEWGYALDAIHGNGDIINAMTFLMETDDCTAGIDFTVDLYRYGLEAMDISEIDSYVEFAIRYYNIVIDAFLIEGILIIDENGDFVDNSDAVMDKISGYIDSDNGYVDSN